MVSARVPSGSARAMLQINSAWLHVLAAHAAIFRPALDRTSTFDVRTIWDPIVFTCMVQVRYISLLKRLQVVKNFICNNA